MNKKKRKKKKKGIHNDCKLVSIIHSITNSKILRGTHYKFILLTNYIILTILWKKKNHNNNCLWFLCPTNKSIKFSDYQKKKETFSFSIKNAEVHVEYLIFYQKLSWDLIYTAVLIMLLYNHLTTFYLLLIAAECYIPNHINLICMCCLYLWR